MARRTRREEEAEEAARWRASENSKYKRAAALDARIEAERVEVAPPPPAKRAVTKCARLAYGPITNAALNADTTYWTPLFTADDGGTDAGVFGTLEGLSWEVHFRTIRNEEYIPLIWALVRYTPTTGQPNPTPILSGGGQEIYADERNLICWGQTIFPPGKESLISTLEIPTNQLEFRFYDVLDIATASNGTVVPPAPAAWTTAGTIIPNPILRFRMKNDLPLNFAVQTDPSPFSAYKQWNGETKTKRKMKKGDALFFGVYASPVNHFTGAYTPDATGVCLQQAIFQFFVKK